MIRLYEIIGQNEYGSDVVLVENVEPDFIEGQLAEYRSLYPGCNVHYRESRYGLLDDWNPRIDDIPLESEHSYLFESAPILITYQYKHYRQVIAARAYRYCDDEPEVPTSEILFKTSDSEGWQLDADSVLAWKPMPPAYQG